MPTISPPPPAVSSVIRKVDFENAAISFAQFRGGAKDMDKQGREIVNLIRQTLGVSDSKLIEVSGDKIIKPKDKTPSPLSDCTIELSQKRFDDGTALYAVHISEKNETRPLEYLRYEFAADGTKYSPIGQVVGSIGWIVGEKFRAFQTPEGLSDLQKVLRLALNPTK